MMGDQNIYPSGEVRSIDKAGLVAVGQHLLHGGHVVPHPGSLVVGKMPNYNSTSRDSIVAIYHLVVSVLLEDRVKRFPRTRRLLQTLLLTSGLSVPAVLAF